MNKDKIIRSTGVDIDVRFILIDCTQTANHIGKLHQAKAYALELMGESIASSLLLASGLKYKGAVQTTFSFSGDISSVESDGTPSGHVRAKIDANELAKVQEFDLMLSEQLMNVKKFNDTGSKIMDSSIEMPSKEIGSSVAAFLLQSEQIRSAVGIKAKISSDPTQLQYCVGFLIEVFPKATEESITQVENSVRSIKDIGVFNVLEKGYDLNALLKHLCGSSEYKIHKEISVQPYCPCSLERVKVSLGGLPKEDLNSMMDEGGAEILCDYCRTRYWLNSQDLTDLLNK